MLKKYLTGAKMPSSDRKIIIRDSTLREGLDVPHLTLTLKQKLKIIKYLDNIGIPEIEIVAPNRVLEDLEFAKELRKKGLKLRTSGLVYSYNPRCQKEIEEAASCLDRLDILMPVSPKRKPYDRDTKISLLLDALAYSLRLQSDVGVGFPHSTQTEISFLLKICKGAVEKGAKRITIYDTNGGKDPFEIYGLINKLKSNLYSLIFFHGHNDLGLATANSLAAVYAGADGLDVTVNGLGDRAGNASLEQVILNLYLKGYNTGIVLQDLEKLSKIVEKASSIPIPKLAPIIGEYAFCHTPLSHQEKPGLFQAFLPEKIGRG